MVQNNVFRKRGRTSSPWHDNSADNTHTKMSPTPPPPTGDQPPGPPPHGSRSHVERQLMPQKVQHGRVAGQHVEGAAQTAGQQPLQHVDEVVVEAGEGRAGVGGQPEPVADAAERCAGGAVEQGRVVQQALGGHHTCRTEGGVRDTENTGGAAEQGRVVQQALGGHHTCGTEEGVRHSAH